MTQSQARRARSHAVRQIRLRRDLPLLLPAFWYQAGKPDLLFTTWND